MPPLPNYNVAPFQPPDLIGNQANLLRLRALQGQIAEQPLREQALQQQVQSGQLQLQQQQQAMKDQQAFRAAMSNPANQGKTIGQVADVLASSGAISQPTYISLKKADLDHRASLANLSKTELDNMNTANSRLQTIYNGVQGKTDQQIAQSWPQLAQEINSTPGSDFRVNPNQPMTLAQIDQAAPFLSMHDAYVDQEIARRTSTEKLKNLLHGGPFQHVIGSVDGKDVYANYDPKSGHFTDQEGNILKDFTPSPKALQGAYGAFGPAYLAYRLYNEAITTNPALLKPLAPLIGKMLSGSGGGDAQTIANVVASVPVGQPQNSQGTPIGLRMPEAPTGATRSRGQFAQSIMPSITRAESQIKFLGNRLGPVQGRWYELYTGKVGAYGPQFSGLQTELKNIGTAWMRLHANSEKARAEFEKVLRASQSPANLVANLNAIGNQAKDYVVEMQGTPAKLNAAPGNAPPGSSSGGKTVSLKSAMALPVNQGKSASEVREDIESHGYEVGP